MTLYCEAFGRGPDVVLLHGWGWHGDAWRDVAQDLARDFRVWIPDLPGFGRSHALTAMPSLDELARAVGDQAPAAATWVGWSLGGLVALAAAPRQRAQRLVLVATTPRFVQDAGWDCAWSAEWLQRFHAEVERDAAGALRRFASLHLAGAGHERPLLRRLRDELLRYPAPAAESLGVLRDADLRSTLASIALPVRVVHGARDQIAPLGAGAALARALPRARLEVIADAGHALPFSHAGFLSNLIREFCFEST
jgi:pimeloyl-[acyl-carrier protein] methyl ester esterase